MDIPILIETTGVDRFTARAGEPFALTAEDVSADQAIEKLRSLIEERLRKGAQLTKLIVPHIVNGHPPGAGIFKDDPIFDDVVRIMAENRHKEDEGNDVP
jgi:hypothetical protein